MESAKVSQKFPEDAGLLRGQPGPKFLQDFPSAGLARQLGLESHEALDIREQLIVLCGCGGTGDPVLKTPLSRILPLLGSSQVIPLPHFGQQ